MFRKLESHFFVGVTKQGLIYFFHFFSCLVGGASPLKRKVLFWFFVFVVTLYFLFTLGFCPGSVKFCQPRLFSPGRVVVSCEFVFSLKFFNGIFSKRIFVFHGKSKGIFLKGNFCFSIGKSKGIFLKRIFVFQLESPRGSFSKGFFVFHLESLRGSFSKGFLFFISFHP